MSYTQHVYIFQITTNNDDNLSVTVVSIGFFTEVVPKRCRVINVLEFPRSRNPQQFDDISCVPYLAKRSLTILGG